MGMHCDKRDAGGLPDRRQPGKGQDPYRSRGELFDEVTEEQRARLDDLERSELFGVAICR